MALRPYQEGAIDNIRAAYQGGARAPLLVMPTGGGKTIVFAHVTMLANARGTRTLVVAHRIELIRQASAKLTHAGVQHGIIAPDYPETAHPVQVGSIQTLARRLDRLPEFDLIIIDEAHHAVAGQWASLIEAQPQARLLGVTATPERLDGKGLGVEAGGPFDWLVQGPSVRELIAWGNLTPARVFAPTNPDLSGIRTERGDFEIHSLASAMAAPAIIGDAVGHYTRHAPGKPAIAFCVTVEHAEDVARAFREAGWRATCAHGGTPAAERDAAIAGLGDATTQILTSCEIVSEGLDVPAIGAAILLRPTQSLPLYMQQVGRGLRPAPGKDHLIVLDHAGNTHRHGLIDDDRQWVLGGKQAREAKERAAGEAFGPGGRKQPPIEFDGQLIEVDTESFDYLRNAPLGNLLTGRDSRERLEQIRLARGYKPGWVYHVMRAQAMHAWAGAR
ncbi:MAG: DEAD/DEAH box helicase [Acetobacteraceae bacterium]|nr:DEAD/DEAH box helicase [Acetobacteraceae bacterium]